MSLNIDKSAWKRVAFGDVVKNVNVTAKEGKTAGTTRVVGLEHLDPGEMKIRRWGSLEDGTTFTRRAQPGQTLFGKRRAYQRKAAYVEFEAVTSSDLLVFEADAAQLLPELLPFLVHSDGFYDHALATSAGSLSPRTNWRDLANFQFDLPPLDEQKRLADLLWAVERHRQSAAATALAGAAAADALFSSMLERHKAKSVPAPDLVEKATVGVVVQPTQYYTDDAESGVPALRGLNVLPGGFDLTDLVFFRPESANELRKSRLQAGDVVVIRTGRPGDAAVVTDKMDGFNCIDLIILRPGPRLAPQFLARYLNSNFGRSQIARRSAGTAQQHFNVGAFRKLLIPALSLDDQSVLVEVAESIQAASNQSDLERQSVTQMRTSLLAEIFGGVR